MGCGNATGACIPAYTIFKTWPITAWDDANCDDDMRFTASDTGFSNKAVMLDWIKHFNAMSFKHTEPFTAMGVSLEDWFGCDHLGLIGGRGDPTTPDDVALAGWAKRAESGQRFYRLLLLDGFAGHGSLELMRYCNSYDIHIGFFPPHLTHLLQPMDVGVFQHLKREHQRALYAHLSQGNLAFNRVDFMTHLTVSIASSFSSRTDGLPQDIWQKTFTVAHLMDGFEKTGIYPINRCLPLEALARRQRSGANPRLVNLLPRVGRHERARAAATRIDDRYRQQFSSPTRQAFDDILSTIGEAVTMARALNSHIQSRETRLQLYQKQRRTRKKVAPSSAFVTSVSAADIRAAAAAEQAAVHTDIIKKQVKAAKKMAREHDEDLKRRWRDDKAIQRQLHGRELDRTFRGWLDRTGAGREYVPFDPKDPRWAMPGDPVGLRDDQLFMADLQGSRISDMLQSQINASARPLRDIRLGSEGPVEFLGLDPGPSTQMPLDPDLVSDGDGDCDIPSSPPDITPTPAARRAGETGYSSCMRIIRDYQAVARDASDLGQAPYTQ